MTVPASVNANDVVAAADVNQYKNVLEGASGYTDTFVMVSTSGTNFVVRLGDAAGANRLSFQNSSSTEKASIDSNGLLSVSSFSAASGNLVLPQSATPSQTTEGSVAWDTDDDRLTVGTGAATKVIGLSRGAGLSASATQELAYDTTAAQLNVWNGSTSVSGSGPFYDNMRTTWRSNRRLVAEVTAQEDDNAGAVVTTATPVGIGFGSLVAGTGDTLANISGEPVMRFNVTANGAPTGVFSVASNTLAATLSPAHSPRMLTRFNPPAASANITVWAVGFVGSSSATANGAHIRIVTTGHPFFVTRQGGSETTFDMGAQVNGTVIGYEIESADAGVTWVLRNQAGTVLATQTTNVPTAASALAFGAVATTATAGTPWGVAHIHVDGTFA